MWKIKFDAHAIKQLSKFDMQWRRKILTFLEGLVRSENPRLKGKQLKGDKKEFWRYRVGDYRILCDIQDKNLTVLVLTVAHRKEAYR